MGVDVAVSVVVFIIINLNILIPLILFHYITASYHCTAHTDCKLRQMLRKFNHRYVRLSIWQSY